MILVLAGCVGKLPFINEPPVLITVNGVAYDVDETLVLPPVEPGEVLELDIVAEDPEGDRFGIWFPGAVGTVDFDPSERSGTIALPPNHAVSALEIVLRDERDPPISASYLVFLGNITYSYGTYGTYGTTTFGPESGDTGDSGY